MDDKSLYAAILEVKEPLGVESVELRPHPRRGPYLGGAAAGHSVGLSEVPPLLSYVAARTSRIRLGTSALLQPYHNPIRLAKTAASLEC